ncbi:hypothetical protein CSW98_05690 [Vibrio sp. HA2012]|uniref:AEC family transporter n=1 Tax=Vibrio sp. HA2012 TaxID=1971595 RepID=UPI000C2B92F6|nr:hypothetical protein [Vibrio sp. HA2012]PJC87389.1 hypothetical protein CSW98_05690 [Vibrio sp. HA2012]
MNQAFLFTFGIIVTGFVLGLLFQRYFSKLAPKVSLVATKIALTSLIPFSVFISLWQLEHMRVELFYLPVIGACVILSGVLVGKIVSARHSLTDKQTAALVPVASMYNLGALGNLIVFSVLGEDGVAVLALFKLFEELIYFGGVFPYAKSKSQDADMRAAKNKRVWRDPIFLIALTAVSSGLALNVAGIERPAFLYSFSHWMIPFGTFLLVLSVGMTFNLKGGKNWRNLAVATALARNLAAVMVVVVLLSVFGLWQADNHLVVSVCLMLAVMPTAFMSTLPAVLYGLDRDIANTGWIASYGVSAVIIPLMLLYVTL